MCDVTGTLSPKEQISERRAAQTDSPAGIHTHTHAHPTHRQSRDNTSSVFYRPHFNWLKLIQFATNLEHGRKKEITCIHATYSHI